MSQKELAEISRPTAGLCQLAPAEGLLAALTRLLASLATPNINPNHMDRQQNSDSEKSKPYVHTYTPIIQRSQKNMKVSLLISQFIQNFPVLNTFGFNCPILSDVHDLTIYQHSCIHEQNITQSDFNTHTIKITTRLRYVGTKTPPNSIVGL